MKIHIQYNTNQAHPTVIAVETTDYELDASQQLRHAADALNMALKTVWGDKAQPIQPTHYTFTLDGKTSKDGPALDEWQTELIRQIAQDEIDRYDAFKKKHL